MLVHSADETRPLQNGVTLASFGGGEFRRATTHKSIQTRGFSSKSAKTGKGSQIGADRNTLLAGSVSWVSPLKLYLRDGGARGRGEKNGEKEINICFKNSFSAWQREI